jgi:MFS family permease
MNQNIDNNPGTTVDSSTTKLNHSISLSGKIIFIFICACNMIQNAIVGGANNAIMTTLESGFYMTSTETGLFQSVYELIAIFAYPIIGYFGDRSGRKVRWIAISMGVLACGFLVMSFPHLLESKRGKPPLDPLVVDHLTLCNPNRTISVCSFSNNLRFLSHLKYVFYLSNIINACGSAALPTLAVTLIEDLFSQEKAPIAQGSFISFQIIISNCIFQVYITQLEESVSVLVFLLHHNFSKFIPI